MERICESCKALFSPHPKVPKQKFCSKKKCQRERRRRWQKQKRLQDKSYRENQAAAQAEWLKENPGYWQKYRKEHPAYTMRNRLLQKQRNENRGNHARIPAFVKEKIAKMDDLTIEKDIISGRYILIPYDSKRVAKMDCLVIKMEVLSSGYIGIQK